MRVWFGREVSGLWFVDVSECISLTLQLLTLTLKPEIAERYLLPDVAALEDVSSLRLEILAISGANSTNLDVEILGCVKGKQD